MANIDSMERVWFDRRKYEEAERKFAEHVASEHASLVVEVDRCKFAVMKLSLLLIRELAYKSTPVMLHQALHLVQLKLVDFFHNKRCPIL